MRRQVLRGVKGAVFLLLLFLLFHGRRNLAGIYRLERLGVYDLGETIPAEDAGSILRQAALIQEEEASGFGKEAGENDGEAMYPHDIVFFNEKKKQTAENPLWYRRVKLTVVEICGDSVLLFPFGYPLEVGDDKGCLLGEESARELFGGTQVIGEEIVYEGRRYEIRGILAQRNLLVIEGGENACFSYAGILGESPLQKDKRLTELQNLCGILLTEVPFRFYGTIVRTELVLLAGLLYALAGFSIWRGSGEKRGIKKAFLLAAVPCLAAGVLFVLSITAYRMPDKVSDMTWWGNYFREERNAWESFFEREEIFLQEDYKEYIAPV